MSHRNNAVVYAPNTPFTFVFIWFRSLFGVCIFVSFLNNKIHHFIIKIEEKQINRAYIFGKRFLLNVRPELLWKGMHVLLVKTSVRQGTPAALAAFLRLGLRLCLGLPPVPLVPKTNNVNIIVIIFFIGKSACNK